MGYVSLSSESQFRRKLDFLGCIHNPLQDSNKNKNHCECRIFGSGTKKEIHDISVLFSSQHRYNTHAYQLRAASQLARIHYRTYQGSCSNIFNCFFCCCVLDSSRDLYFLLYRKYKFELFSVAVFF